MKLYKLARDGVTQSLLQGFMLCRRYAQLALARWTPTKMSMPIAFGGMFHFACEFYYEHLVHGKPVDPVAATRFAERMWGREKKKLVMSPEEEQSAELAIAVLEVLFPAYVSHYQKKDNKRKWTESEHEFDVPYQIPGTKIHTTLRGKLDGRFISSKKVWIKDTKTKSRIEEAFLLDLLTLDLQVGFYMLAEEEGTGNVVGGFEYDMVRRPGLQLNKKETMGQFQRRIAGDIKKRPEHYFKRVDITMTKEDRERFREDLNCVLREFALWINNDPQVPTYHRTANCTTRYGPCRYLPICARDDYSAFTRREDLFPELEG